MPPLRVEMTNSIDTELIQKDFPILSTQVNGQRLVYLDSAASSQKPIQVLEAMDKYYSTTHANVHRGVYAIAENATNLYERARVVVGRFIGAPNPAREIVFTKNATEAVNLVAYSWGRANLTNSDVVLLTEMEHHANIVPWQILAQQLGFEIRFIPIDRSGYLNLSEIDSLLSGVKLVGVTASSNVLGTITEISDLIGRAHSVGALVIVDGAQFVPHLPANVQEIGCDFFVATGHKMLGPTGIGFLWGRETLLDAMPAFLGGGEMICDVRKDGFTPNDLPYKFEAGTPPIAEAIGLMEAVAYLEKLGMANIRAHEIELVGYALDRLKSEFGKSIEIFGPSNPQDRGGVVSFSFKNLHPHDISQILDSEGVCIRAGHHCAKPLMRVLDVSATARASLYIYNDYADVEALVTGLYKADKFFGI